MREWFRALFIRIGMLMAAVFSFVLGARNVRSLSVVGGSGTSLTRTQGTGTSRRKMTYSAWYKWESLGADGEPAAAILAYADNDSLFDSIQINDAFEDHTNAPVVYFGGVPVATTGVTNDLDWHNLLVQIDTAQATATNRVKLFVDGVNVTNTGSTYPAQNYNLGWGRVGGEQALVAGNYQSVLVDEVARFDGQTYAYADVSTADAPKSLAALTFGAEGYWLRFETGLAATVGKDSSMNTNNFTNNGYETADFSVTVP